MNNKLLLSASLATFIGIIMAIHICDKEKNKEENKQLKMTIPVSMNIDGRDTIIWYAPVTVTDSIVALDSVGIKTVGYKIKK